MSLESMARVRLAHLPTPLEDAPRLSALLGGPPIPVKRDDMTGPDFGGNKTRKLIIDFILTYCLQWVGWRRYRRFPRTRWLHNHGPSGLGKSLAVCAFVMRNITLPCCIEESHP